MHDFDEFKYLLQSGRLGLLVGSGLSTPFFAALGDIENRLEELAKKPDSDDKVIIRSSIVREYFNKCIKNNQELARGEFDAGEEDVLKDYQELLNSINKVVLLRRSNLLNKQINIFTTNVDIFFEKALESQKIEFNDGFMGRLEPRFELSNYKKSVFKTSSHYDNTSEVPIFNLFKLHGSVTWKMLENDRIGLDNNLDIIGKVRDCLENIPQDNLLEVTKTVDEREVLRSIDELFEEQEEKKLLVSDEINKLLSAYDEIIMINPNKEKFKFTTLNYTYYELLRMFSNELEKENSILFVMGFSFADEHIKEIVLRSLHSNPTLIICVFAHSPDAKQQILKNLGFEGDTPIKNNLKFVDFKGEKEPYNLRNINKYHFTELAEKLTNGTKKDDEK